MANTNGNNEGMLKNGEIEVIKPITLDELGQKAVRKLARMSKSYEGLSANQTADLIFRKAIRQMFNAEFEGKHKAAFKSYQSVNRKMDKTSELTLSEYLDKYQSDEDKKLLADLKAYGEK